MCVCIFYATNMKYEKLYNIFFISIRTKTKFQEYEKIKLNFKLHLKKNLS